MGNASAIYLRGLRRAGIPVSWSPLSWPSSPWRCPFGRAGAEDPVDLSDAEHADLVDREIDHDSVVVCSTPFWHDRIRAEAGARRLVAYTAWETDRLPTPLVDHLSHHDLVLVPSRFNAEVFTRSGIEVPVVAVPHGVDDDRRPVVGGSHGPHPVVFYTIASWSTRKAIRDIVTAFVTAFSDADPVALVIYTHPNDLIAGEGIVRGDRPPTRRADASWRSLAEILANRRRVPRITLDIRVRTNEQVAAAHRQGDCFVGLSRGEGWGLGAFEAGAAANPVVVTGWGGWLDFLPPGYPFCVEFDLVPTTTDPPDRWWSPVPGERWAKVRVEHAASQLRWVFEHQEEARRWGQRLRGHISEHFSTPTVTRQLVLAIDGLR
jgi:glycosyltransferase involved in cell wall biosynthesis